MKLQEAIVPIITGLLIGWTIGLILLALFLDEIFSGLDWIVNKVRYILRFK